MSTAADTMKTLVIVPTYNERDNIERLCRLLLGQGTGVEVLVVDDNSPDGTAQVVRRLRQETPRVHLLPRPGKLGLGTAHVDGFRRALEGDYQRVVTMDADFSHPPEALPAMLEASRDADVVLGSRYVTGGGYEDWPWHRAFLSTMSNLVARTALRLTPKDCTGAYRCFRRAVLEQVAFENIVSRGYSFQEEMLWHCSGRGWTIAEVPIRFVDRAAGQTKMGVHEIWGGVWTVLRLMFTPEGRRLAGARAGGRAERPAH